VLPCQQILIRKPVPGRPCREMGETWTTHTVDVHRAWLQAVSCSMGLRASSRDSAGLRHGASSPGQASRPFRSADSCGPGHVQALNRRGQALVHGNPGAAASLDPLMLPCGASSIRPAFHDLFVLAQRSSCARPPSVFLLRRVPLYELFQDLQVKTGSPVLSR